MRRARLGLGSCDARIALGIIIGVGSVQCPGRRPGIATNSAVNAESVQYGRFLCPRCRAGDCDSRRYFAEQRRRGRKFLCPRGRAGDCDRAGTPECPRPSYLCFYALGVGLGIATDGRPGRPALRVSMPSASGGVLRLAGVRREPQVSVKGFLCPRGRAGYCDIADPQAAPDARVFLCPRGRAGDCDDSYLATVDLDEVVSMPSGSGGGLRRMRSWRGRDLRDWCPFRHPL